MPSFWARFVDSIVFQPPKKQSYSFVLTGGGIDGDLQLQLQFHDEAAQTESDVDVGWWASSSGNYIAYAFIRPGEGRKPRAAIVFSSTNACDMGYNYLMSKELATKLCCDVLCYDYSGYGLSTGHPSEPNFYADAEAAVEVMRVRYGYQEKNIVLYGMSLGTVACVKLATEKDRNFPGVVLQAPLLSAGRFLWSGFRWLPCIDRFNTAQRFGKIQCPVLITHDVLDSMTPFNHCLGLYKLCPTTCDLGITVGMGHIQPFSCIQCHVANFFDKVTMPLKPFRGGLYQCYVGENHKNRKKISSHVWIFGVLTKF